MLIISSNYFTGISQITGDALAVILGFKRGMDALQIPSSEQVRSTLGCGCGVCCQLTLVVQLSSVFLPALQTHPLPKQVQKLLKCWARALVVVHVFL